MRHIRPVPGLERRDPDTSEFHQTLDGIPDGEYFIFTFKSAFENRSFAYEVIAVAKEPDSSWRVMGYLSLVINPYPPYAALWSSRV